jgi:iron complex transport system substrate-binding protein
VAAERVVTLAPHLAELVCAVGACERLVGVVAHTDEAGAREVPRIGDAFSLNPEAVLALRPDLVLAWRGGTSPQLVERLQGLKIPVRWVAVNTLDDVGAALLDIGGLLSREDAACAAEARYRERLAQLRERYARRLALRVLYQIEAQPMFTVNRQSPISEAIELCGGLNVFADMPLLSAPVSTEAVLAARPDVIIYGRQDMAAAIRAFWSRWPQLRAIRERQLYAIDADLLTRQSPRVLDGVSELCETLETARRRQAPKPGSS